MILPVNLVQYSNLYAVIQSWAFFEQGKKVCINVTFFCENIQRTVHEKTLACNAVFLSCID